MAKRLTEARYRVLADLLATVGDHSYRMRRRLGMTMTSVQSALQWCRKSGFAEYDGYWHITADGRQALAQEDSRERD